MAEGQKSRIIFMGTSVFSEVILRALLGYDGGEIVGVLAQPDKTAGRGLKLASHEVKKLAIERDLPLLQPRSLKLPGIAEELAAMRPDFIISAAYGLILPENILRLPKVAALNAHASLLPKYRGAAPIQTAIMDNWMPGGKTGVSIMEMVQEMDAGPVYANVDVPINGMDYTELRDALARAGASLLLKILPQITSGALKPRAQDDSLATYAPKLRKENGHIDWNQSALRIDALIRAVTPWPGARTLFKLEGQEKSIAMTILRGKVGESRGDATPGNIYRDKNGLRIACADNWYILEKVHPGDKKEMTARDFANGQCRVKKGLCGSCANIQ